MQARPIVYAEFSEAYTFRATIELVRHICTQANFVFYPDRIELARGNADFTAMAEWSIDTDKIIRYAYNTYDEEGEKLDCLAAGFNLVELVKGTKGISKKDGMRLFILPDDNKINIQVLIGGEKPQGTAYVQLVEAPVIEYEAMKYSRSEDSPNVRIHSPVFAKMCSSVAAIRCQNLKFVGYDNGVECTGILADSSIGRKQPFGDCKPSESLPLQTPSRRINLRPKEDFNTMMIKTMPIVKAMGRLGNITNLGILKLTMEIGKPIRLALNVGAYGQLHIYLRSTAPAGQGDGPQYDGIAPQDDVSQGDVSPRPEGNID